MWPTLATAQVAVRHAVAADVAPLLVVRDSVTVAARPDSAWRWSGTVAGNVAFVLEAGADSGVVEARLPGGAWTTLAGAWQALAGGGPGRTAVVVEFRAAGGSAAGRPRFRALSR